MFSFCRSLLDELRKEHEYDPRDRHGSNEATERMVRMLGRLGSRSVSVETKLSLLSRLQDVPEKEKMTEQCVVQMLSSESGDLISCLVTTIDIFTDTLATQRSSLLHQTLIFVNKCLRKFGFALRLLHNM